jgi:hypothetical protein
VTVPTGTAVTAFPTTRPSLAFSSDNHLRFLHPRALARLRDARLRRWNRTCRPPLPSTLEVAPLSSSSPPPLARDCESIVTVSYFVLASRLRAPRCPQRKKLAAAKPVVLFASPPSILNLSIETVIEFLNVPTMMAAKEPLARAPPCPRGKKGPEPRGLKRSKQVEGSVATPTTVQDGVLLGHSQCKTLS